MSTSRTFALASALLLAGANLVAQDAAQKVEGGGISVTGWKGRVDANEAANGQTIQNAKLFGDAKALHVATGPASIYWKEGSVAKGDYTVRASFTEPKYMNRMSHPHPY